MTESCSRIIDIPRDKTIIAMTASPSPAPSCWGLSWSGWKSGEGQGIAFYTSYKMQILKPKKAILEIKFEYLMKASDIWK